MKLLCLGGLRGTEETKGEGDGIRGRLLPEARRAGQASLNRGATLTPRGDELFLPRGGTRTFPVEGAACQNPACWSSWGVGSSLRPILDGGSGGSERCMQSLRLGVRGCQAEQG